MDDLLAKAILVATQAHSGQVRKSSDAPYITHPVNVACLVGRYVDKDYNITGSIVALLHDVLEDVPPNVYSKDDMIKDFGEYITTYVSILTEPKIAGEEHQLPWRERKEAYLKQISDAPYPVNIVSACDKIANIDEILREHREKGDKVWEFFKVGPEEQLWFFLECYRSLHLPEELDTRFLSAIHEFKCLVQKSSVLD